MITTEMIARINELARKQREGTLTEAETAEQAKLRRQYVEVIKARVREQIETAKIGDHPPGCNCGHHH